MKAFLAIYDPSQPSGDGTFWSWRSTSLDLNQLDNLYYGFAKNNRPESPNQLAQATIIGGFVHFHNNMVYAYRFGNGGHDIHGRPERFVMIVAGMVLDPSESIDLAGLLNCQTVVDILAKAPTTCPMPAPAELEIEVPENLFSADIVFIAKVLRGERLEFSGPEALLQASAVCGSLPVDRFWKCQVSMKGKMPFAVVELVPQKPKTIAPVLVVKSETETDKPPVLSQTKKPHETTLLIRRLLGRSLLALVVFCLSFLCYLEFPWPLILCYFWPPPLSNIEIKVNLGNGVMLVMVKISSGKFMMGSPMTEKGRSPSETQHDVTLTKGFLIGKYEVTQEQWEIVMGVKQSINKGQNLPITKVSWNDCQDFIKKLNAKTNGDYRLPTEAEWEYACRGGETTAYSFGDKITPKDANYGGDDDGAPTAVGCFKKNAFGLYDMHGNVAEWCEDIEGEYPKDSVTDPKGPLMGERRIFRGGSFASGESDIRSSSRGNGSQIEKGKPQIGFRIVKVP